MEGKEKKSKAEALLSLTLLGAIHEARAMVKVQRVSVRDRGMYQEQCHSLSEEGH